MRKIYFLSLIFLLMIFSCKDDERMEGVKVESSFVNFDINAVPYSKLSTYAFFKGDLKNLDPVDKVIPYEPASSLFTDYASKKRFIWMPQDVKATFDADDKTLNFPMGTVLIKNFYYNTIQPGNTTKIIETRLMIKKSSGWIFAEYLWNDDQTEANLVTGTDFTSGSSKNITFKKDNGDVITTDYRIPSETECYACHKLDNKPVPIGVKPQNLNVAYNYPNGLKNQLQKLVDEGYLQSYPSNIVSTVNYKDTSKPLDIRLRSYLDINCAHCHQDNARCDYRAIRLSFSQTTNLAKLGVCIFADEPIDPSLERIITPGNPGKSVMHFRLSSTNESNRMPLLGRTIVHDEGVDLLKQWISGLTQNCP
ncbi:putative repeat protein (TIGR03806 family) [Chryseobacterium ginsenosidimutans]|uniref:hypothetical protein n=1 Tax=Chryseobacterium ginsenosidimutans TaxID=687846 RepID=UPI00216A2CBD|nr:hypothetical protein [Chryseobacterium ginsenosidimutans]MCS3867132.1 putative repeat protein (TIGR03806 family) [Chryseobacterium ginsenosidimutans]